MTSKIVGRFGGDAARQRAEAFAEEVARRRDEVRAYYCSLPVSETMEAEYAKWQAEENSLDDLAETLGVSRKFLDSAAAHSPQQ